MYLPHLHELLNQQSKPQLSSSKVSWNLLLMRFVNDIMIVWGLQRGIFGCKEHCAIEELSFRCRTRLRKISNSVIVVAILKVNNLWLLLGLVWHWCIYYYAFLQNFLSIRDKRVLPICLQKLREFLDSHSVTGLSHPSPHLSPSSPSTPKMGLLAACTADCPICSHWDLVLTEHQPHAGSMLLWTAHLRHCHWRYTCTIGDRAFWIRASVF